MDHENDTEAFDATIHLQLPVYTNIDCKLPIRKLWNWQELVKHLKWTNFIR